jgi:hypothetical protein
MASCGLNLYSLGPKSQPMASKTTTIQLANIILNATTILVAKWVVSDAEVHHQYMAVTAEDSRKVQEAIEAGVLEPLNAAHIAATTRNDWVEDGRRYTSPIGLLVAKVYKKTGHPTTRILSRKIFEKILHKTL